MDKLVRFPNPFTFMFVCTWEHDKIVFDDLLSCSALFCFGGIPLLMKGNRALAQVGSNKLLIVIFTNVLPAVPIAGVGIFCSWYQLGPPT